MSEEPNTIMKSLAKKLGFLYISVEKAGFQIYKWVKSISLTGTRLTWFEDSRLFPIMSRPVRLWFHFAKLLVWKSWHSRYRTLACLAFPPLQELDHQGAFANLGLVEGKNKIQVIKLMLHFGHKFFADLPISEFTKPANGNGDRM